MILEKIYSGLRELEMQADLDAFMRAQEFETVSATNYAATCPVAQFLRKWCGFPVMVLASIAYHPDERGYEQLPLRVQQWVQQYDTHHLTRAQ